MGVIESGEQFAHVFTIRNAGDGPLSLTPGPKLCACTVTNLPERPIPPGGQAKIRVSFSDSVKHEPMKQGRFSRGVRVLTNDPDHADMLLEVSFTVNRRLVAVPPDVTLALDSSKRLSPDQRTARILVYSERWDRFQLSVGRASSRGIQWRIEPAEKGQCGDPAARCGYRVAVTMPSELPEGPLAEWIELVGQPAKGQESGGRDRGMGGQGEVLAGGGAGPAALVPAPGSAGSLRFPIHGSVHGRLELHSPKLLGGNLLLLGTLRQGQAVHETVLVKLNDDRRQLSVRRIETDPPFLHASLAPHHAGADRIGLYRIDVKLAADSPSLRLSAPHRGRIRLGTDHPRLPLIELKVDFCIVATGKGASG